MNLFQIFNSIAEVDDKALDRFDTRRAAFGHLFSTGKKISLAAAPTFMAALFNKAYAGEQGTQETVQQVLAYALTLERLEYNFYLEGLAAGGLALTPDERAGLTEIRNNEQSHVTLLESVVTAPPAAVTYKFNKVYTDVFTNPVTFLAVAQALEDTGVRAYKGRAAELQIDPAMLQVALNIHSVEARHASYVRRLRNENAWITNDDTTIPNITFAATPPATGNITVAGKAFYQASANATLAATHPSEANTAQGGLTGLYAGNGIAASRYTEAFDEPIDKDTVVSTVTALFL